MRIVGHRGARGLAPENTIASLKKGIEHHADELEFDLRVTKDGLVVLHHDPELTDASGGKLKISGHTYKQLKEHKPDLTTFEEVLRIIGHHVTLHVEVKGGEPTKPIIKIIEEHLDRGWKPSYFLLASKDFETLQQLHKALPAIQKVVIEPWSGVRATRRARQLNTKRLSMNQRWLWWGFIRSMKRKGWELYPYTLNDPKKAKRWFRYGITGVITDYPDRFEK